MKIACGSANQTVVSVSLKNLRGSIMATENFPRSQWEFAWNKGLPSGYLTVSHGSHGP